MHFESYRSMAMTDRSKEGVDKDVSVSGTVLEIQKMFHRWKNYNGGDCVRCYMTSSRIHWDKSIWLERDQMYSIQQKYMVMYTDKFDGDPVRETNGIEQTIDVHKAKMSF